MGRHVEHHLIERIGWLRAAILGANDGIISTGSLMVGVASASTSAGQILLALATRHVAYWHETDMASVVSDVCSPG